MEASKKKALSQHDNKSQIRHIAGVLAGFMWFYNMGNVIQYANITIEGSWTLLMVAISLGAVIDFCIPILIYVRYEQLRKVLISSVSFWVTTSVNLAFTGLYIAAHILAIMKLVEANEKWWLEHKDNPNPKVEKECYECNAWISRLIISVILQPGVTLFLFIYMVRYVTESQRALRYKSIPASSAEAVVNTNDDA